MAKLMRIHGWVLLVVILYAPAVQAQQTDSAKNDPREQPVAPYPALLPSWSTSKSGLDFPQAPTAEVQAAADNRPLSGVQGVAAGPNLGARNFLVPSINVTSQLTMSPSASGYAAPATFSYLLGMLDLGHVSDRSELLVHYTGGEMVSSYLNSAIQDLEFSYGFKWQRWSLLVGEQVSFLSESPFGFGGVGGLSFLNGVPQVGSFLNTPLTPSQTIPTIIAPRLSNTLVSQIEYKLSPRSSWTAAGSFGMLNFLGAGFINSTEGLFQTGYNYSLSPRSSIAVIYRFQAFRFTQFPQGIQNHVVELGYARSVTGRLTFQFAAGPSLETLRGLLTGSANRLSWNVDSSLSYRRDRTALLLSYDHLLTGGSGVLVGAQTGQVEATVERNLTLRWQGSAALGYATNRSLIPLIPGSGVQSYNSWYAAVRLSHQLRPGTAFFVSYGARLQATNAGACGTPTCGGNFVGHEISAGFNFGLRPILLR